MTGWNIQVHVWLKYYIMLRLMDRTKPKGQMQFVPMALTFIISALWHGLQVGFFMMFAGFAIMEYVMKMGERTTLAVWIIDTIPFILRHPIKWFI